MNLLCDAAYHELAKLEREGLLGEWHVEAPSTNNCVVRLTNMLIKLNLDPRISHVTSAVEYVGVPEQIQDELDLFVISKIFSNEDLSSAPETKDIPTQVAAEVRRAVEFGRAAEREGIAPRDVFYFQLGYNTAYTDRVSISG